MDVSIIKDLDGRGCPAPLRCLDGRVLIALDGQGNRVNGLCGDEACREVVIPCCDLASKAEGILAGRVSDRVVGHVLQGCEIGGGVLGSHSAFVITEDHVHDPVQAVLDGPMTPNDWTEESGGKRQWCDVKARPGLDFISDLPRGL